MTHCSPAVLWSQGGTALAAAGALTGSGACSTGPRPGRRRRRGSPRAARSFPAALEALRAGRGRRLHEAGRRLHQGDRRQGQRLERIARGRAAEGLGGRQHRRRARHGLGPLLAAAPVPAEVRRRHRRRRLSRQEVRRLGAERGHLRQERQQVDRHSGRYNGGLHELPHLVDREGRLQGVPGGHRELPRAVPRR